MDLSIIQQSLVGLNFDTAVDTLMKASVELEQQPCPVKHHFSPGMYIREVSMSAGTFAIGHYHREEHLNVFLKGSIMVFKEGQEPTVLDAPKLFVAQPGRKVGLMLTDVVWYNIWATDETDIEKLEDRFIDKNFRGVWDTIQPEPRDVTEDHEDYLQVLKEFGYTEETVRLECDRTDDMIPFSKGTYIVSVLPSPIHGKGLFATTDIEAGRIIVTGRLGRFRTPAGRYTNHSKHPNARWVEDHGDMFLQAIVPIKGYRGGFVGEEITIDYRQALKLRGVSQCQQ